MGLFKKSLVSKNLLSINYDTRLSIIDWGTGMPTMPFTSKSLVTSIIIISVGCSLMEVLTSYKTESRVIEDSKEWAKKMLPLWSDEILMSNHLAPSDKIVRIDYVYGTAIPWAIRFIEAGVNNYNNYCASEPKTSSARPITNAELRFTMVKPAWCAPGMATCPIVRLAKAG